MTIKTESNEAYIARAILDLLELTKEVRSERMQGETTNRLNKREIERLHFIRSHAVTFCHVGATINGVAYYSTAGIMATIDGVGRYVQIAFNEPHFESQVSFSVETNEQVSTIEDLARIADCSQNDIIDMLKELRILDATWTQYRDDGEPELTDEQQASQDEMGFILRKAMEHIKKEPNEDGGVEEVVENTYDAWTKDCPPFITSIECCHMLENKEKTVRTVRKVAFTIADGGPIAHIVFYFNKDESLLRVAYEAEYYHDKLTLENAHVIANYLYDTTDWDKEHFIKSLHDFGEWLSTQFQSYL